MKKYMKPYIEQLDVELEQMMAASVEIDNIDALATDGVFYDENRLDSFAGE